VGQEVYSTSDPAKNFAAVTPHDTTNFGPASRPTLTRALYVGGAGNVVVVGEGDVPVTFTAVPAGTFLPVRCKRVNNTGTTATAIVRLW